MRLQIHDHFFADAANMREQFLRRQGSPLKAEAQRFVWDYWHVPDQYTLLRTPAHAFFSKALYARFHRHLVEWGRANLGCHDVSPPWLSGYVEGCRQELHCDVPHGPLAFVYSLTPWSTRTFTGGETFMLKDQVLNFWQADAAGLEKRDLVQSVAPRFNRLVVFNPAIPHGVSEVRGTHDLCSGRLVIHGWFVQPRPFWYGPLRAGEVSRAIESGLENVLAGQLPELGKGLIVHRLQISPNGHVKSVKALVNTLHGTDTRSGVRPLRGLLTKLQFPKKSTGSVLTLPLMCS